MTQSFCILAALWALVSVSFLVQSCIPALSAPGRGPLVSTVMAFAAGMNGIWAVLGHLGWRILQWPSQLSCLLFLSPAVSILVAMTVYTSTRWSQSPSPQVQTFFSWSFYLGWISFILFLFAGDYSPTSLGEDHDGGWSRAV